MGLPVSIRLADDVRQELEQQAQERNIGLSTLLRELATEAAAASRRARIRRASAAVAAYVAGSSEAQEFYEAVGTPTTDVCV
jgi:hypothetical protein